MCGYGFFEPSWDTCKVQKTQWPSWCMALMFHSIHMTSSKLGTCKVRIIYMDIKLYFRTMHVSYIYLYYHIYCMSVDIWCKYIYIYICMCIYIYKRVYVMHEHVYVYLIVSTKYVSTYRHHKIRLDWFWTCAVSVKTLWPTARNSQVINWSLFSTRDGGQCVVAYSKPIEDRKVYSYIYIYS